MGQQSAGRSQWLANEAGALRMADGSSLDGKEPPTINLFRRTFITNCRAALEQAAEAGALGHPGLVGQAREIFVTRMLTPTLPPEVKLGTGQLVASNGAKSPQIDVVLYAPAILPPWLYDPSSGMFPIESCLYWVEVKSRLNAATLFQAIENARRTGDLPLIQTEHWRAVSTHKLVDGFVTATPNPIPVLFALGSDLISSAEAEMMRYRALDEQADIRPAFRVICVVGRGYWYFGDTRWLHVAASPDLDEVMSFLAGLTNTVPQLLAAKGRPRFGRYIESKEAKHQPA
jgi:hypothetical protein